MSRAIVKGSSTGGRGSVVRLVLAAAVFLLVVVAVVLDAGRYFAVEEQVLPDLVGMPFDQAARLLRSQGFDPVTFVEHVEGAPADAVTSQSPEPGTVVKRLRSIHLGVNTPPAAAVLPDMLGMLEPAAKARAAELNLPLGLIQYQPSDRPAGTVIAQEPPGGLRLAEGASIALVVSSGPERQSVTLPDLVGTDVDEAVQQLARLGFGRVEALPSGVSFSQPRVVVAMHPAAGEVVPPGTPVLLSYSLSTANVVQVPDVIGQPQWQAQLAIGAAQLRVGQITFVQDPERPEGVVDVRPTGYTAPGTPVFLTVNGTPSGGLVPDFTLPDATGPTDIGGGTDPSGGETVGDGSRLVPFTFDPTNMGVKRLLEQPYSLKLIVNDDRGERVVFDRRVGAGQSVVTSVAIYGQEAMLQTYVDDVFFQAWRP
ncbi:MAG: PASTA domain-containing protein [Trueperaceae bacterium]|nr:PASTA domain-containing protein [Trueperaceae bacterium]MCC6310736.1 PASTA domain-containing protein [Trueperaceae bacterium]MCO5174117.1 PASTA domain-containing protein [Trueperaceae bacterium]MCW5820020.1 PASTA domain-containing protein [Trueperaceae bacterium]